MTCVSLSLAGSVQPNSGLTVGGDSSEAIRKDEQCDLLPTPGWQTWPLFTVVTRECGLFLAQELFVRLD